MKNKIHYSIFVFCALLIGVSYSNIIAQDKKFSVIPMPVSIKYDNGFFTFNDDTKIICNVNSYEYSVAEYLYNNLSKTNTRIKPILAKVDNPKYNTANSIIFILSSDKVLGKEGYQINILGDRIILSANENAGFFNGVQTLIQIISSDKKIPCSVIIDYPRFAYRGKHLDCSRHFFTKDEIKKYIDILAYHKINTFHWHLTDDQGWRIEIKKYPKLHLIGSKRKETLVGHYSDNFPQKFDGKEYGGYYTQEEIKEIVQYAKERYITVIPEIEMPGHALAALSAYPELSCRNKPLEAACTWGVFDDVFCNKEETFTFLEDVLEEVVALFPSKYIHIGGDECPKTRWKECPNCQKVIKENGLKNEYDLQSYFMNRIEKFLEKKGRKVIGWDEILEGGLNGNATIMSWQGESGGIAAAKSGHDAIMTPSAYLYFNFNQGNPDQEPLSIGGYTLLKKVYNYEPIPQELNEKEAKHIIGVQACTWTEYIPNFDMLQYMDLPRLSALSEIAWTKKENKNYDDFLLRVEEQLKRYKSLGLKYALSHYAIQTSTYYNEIKKQVEIKLSSYSKQATIYYTLDGSEPTIKSKKYSKPIIIKNNSTLKAIAFRDQEKISPLFTQTYAINKATGKKYIMENVNPQYPGSSQYALTDGLFGTKKGFDRWVGTLGKDYIVSLDLGLKTNIKTISINFLDEQGSWVFAPSEVTFFTSTDGKQWKEIKKILTKGLTPKEKIYNYFAQEEVKGVRYIKIEAKSIITCPEGHPGFGYSAHCFADEITIE